MQIDEWKELRPEIALHITGFDKTVKSMQQKVFWKGVLKHWEKHMEKNELQLLPHTTHKM